MLYTLIAPGFFRHCHATSEFGALSFPQMGPLASQGPGGGGGRKGGMQGLGSGPLP